MPRFPTERHRKQDFEHALEGHRRVHPETGCGSASTCCSTAGVVWGRARGPSQLAYWWSLGVQPDDAIRRVRGRPRRGPSRTTPQLAHVRQCSVQSTIGFHPGPRTDIHDRALGAFLGLAVGRRGRHGRSNSAPAIRSPRPRRHGPVGGPLDLPAGAWTDDTAHGAGPLPTAWWNPRRLDCRDLMGPFREVVARTGGLLVEREIASTSENTTCQALTRYLRDGWDPGRGVSTDPWSAGNGSADAARPPLALRFRHGPAAPCSQQLPTSPRDDPTEPRKQWGRLPGVRRAPGQTPSPGHRFSGRSGSEDGFTGAAAITQVIAGSWRGTGPRDTIRSSGYVVHTLEAAIWSVRPAPEDFRGAVAARGQPGRRRRYGSSSDGGSSPAPSTA